MARILAFAGSARKDSANKKLVRYASERAREAGGDVTVIDLADFVIPLYDQDLQQAEGFPENATRLYDLMKQHEGLLLACPEYNSSITALLKNAIDWASRPREGDPPLAAFAGKTAALMAASPGGLGGLRGLVHVRSILGNIGVIVLPNQVAVAHAYTAFADDGTIHDDKLSTKIADLSKQLVDATNKLHPER